MSADGQQQQPGVLDTRLVIRSRPLPAAAPELPAPGPGDHHLTMIEKAMLSGSDEANVPEVSGRAHIAVNGQREVITIGFSDEDEEKFANMRPEEIRRTLKNLALHAHGQEISTQTHANLLQSVDNTLGSINKGALALSRQVQVLRRTTDESLNQGGGICKAQKVINNQMTETSKKDHKRLARLEIENRKQAAEIEALKSTAEEQATTIKQQAAEIEGLKATVAKLVSWVEAKEA